MYIYIQVASLDNKKIQNVPITSNEYYDNYNNKYNNLKNRDK